MSAVEEALAEADAEVLAAEETLDSVEPSESPMESLASSLSDVDLDVKADPPLSETERLDIDPTGPVVLESGLELEIVPMNLRETMKLLKIVTHGAGPILSQQFSSLDFENPDEFAQALLAILLMSVGDAETELVEFLQAMCQPVGFNDIKDGKKRTELARRMMVELYNPTIDTALSILTRVVAQEAENLRGLGKKIGAVTKVMRARLAK